MNAMVICCSSLKLTPVRRATDNAVISGSATATVFDYVVVGGGVGTAAAAAAAVTMAVIPPTKTLG